MVVFYTVHASSWNDDVNRECKFYNWWWVLKLFSEMDLEIPSMLVNQNEMKGYKVGAFLNDTLRFFCFHSFLLWSRSRCCVLFQSLHGIAVTPFTVGWLYRQRSCCLWGSRCKSFLHCEELFSVGVYTRGHRLDPSGNCRLQLLKTFCYLAELCYLR